MGWRRLVREPVELPALAGPLAAVWDGVCVLADALTDVPWTVVGGQMVFLHGAEHGVPAHRVSADIDAAVDVRAAPLGLRRLVAVLTDLEFESVGQTPQGHAYRFEKRTGGGVTAVDVTVDPDDVVAVDLLAPEGLGVRADLRTVGMGTAFPAPGVSQALARTELVPIRVAEAVHWVPRPNLLGAIVGKATASVVDTVEPERHRLDLAFLCGLVADPFAMAEEVTRKDRARLRAAATAVSPDDPAWRAATRSADARLALEILVGDEALG